LSVCTNFTSVSIPFAAQKVYADVEAIDNSQTLHNAVFIETLLSQRDKSAWLAPDSFADFLCVGFAALRSFAMLLFLKIIFIKL